MVQLVSVIPYKGNGNFRYTATFKYTDGKSIKVNFGDKRYDNYTIHKDDNRKQRYLIRHHPNEDWYNPMTKGALSRWLLWSKPTLRESIADFKRFFSI